MMILLLLVIGSTACSSGSDPSQNATEPDTPATPPSTTSSTTPSNNTTTTTPTKPPDPVKLTIFTPASNGTLENFMEVYGDDIVKKFPHVSFDYVGGLQWATEIPALLGTNTSIDFVGVQAVSFNHVVKVFDLQYDIDELIKKHNYDLSVIQPNVIQGMRELTPEGKLYGLPVSTSTFPLMYNIDIFDKFGEDYPHDHMVWDEVYEIARRLTRVEDNLQYYGLVTDFTAYSIFNSLSASYIDPNTNTAMFSADERWTKLTNNIVRFFQVSGMDLSGGWSWNSTTKVFHEAQLAAMAYYPVTLTSTANWDMVTGASSRYTGLCFAEHQDRPICRWTRND